MPRARAQALFLSTLGIGCMALESAKPIWKKSILDCDPPEIEDPSEDERVSPPQLEVQVLEHECAVGAALVNTGTAQTREQFSNVAL